MHTLGNPVPIVEKSFVARRPGFKRIRHAASRALVDEYPPLVQSSHFWKGFKPLYGMIENTSDHVFGEFLAGCAIGNRRQRRNFAPLDRGVGLKLTNHFLASPSASST